VSAGGCLCGAVRYAVAGEPIDAGFCHCRLCQRQSGAPVVAWATFPRAAVTFTGPAAAFRATPAATRTFCPKCGTNLAFAADGTGRVDLTLASLDDPDAWPPEYHIWTASKRPWLHLADRLPASADAGPDR
jgi:hypothetical protein